MHNGEKKRREERERGFKTQREYLKHRREGTKQRGIFETKRERDVFTEGDVKNRGEGCTTCSQVDERIFEREG